MTNLLRNALKAKHLHHLALEEIVGEVPADDTVLMKGPLAEVYSNALAEVYDKANPLIAGDPTAAPEPGAETGMNIAPDAAIPEPGTTLEVTEETNIPEMTQAVLESLRLSIESQAIDAAMIQDMQEASVAEAPNEGQYATLYAIDESQVEPQNIVEVTQLLADAPNPENVSVMVVDVVPQTEIVADENAGNEIVKEDTIVALEKLVVAMGGKFYRQFDQYLAGRRK